MVNKKKIYCSCQICKRNISYIERIGIWNKKEYLCSAYVCELCKSDLGITKFQGDTQLSNYKEQFFKFNKEEAIIKSDNYINKYFLI